MRFEGLRSTRGLLRACMTGTPAAFLKCDQDAAAHKGSIAAREGAELRFSHVAPGDYALVVLHDENSNAKVDKLIGIPREGVGFSNNPRLIMGPPAVGAVRFHVTTGAVTQTIHLKYFL